MRVILDLKDYDRVLDPEAAGDAVKDLRQPSLLISNWQRAIDRDPELARRKEVRDQFAELQGLLQAVLVQPERSDDART